LDEDDEIIGHRGFEYPSGPPPAYSSGEHTPEENPLIGEDDEDVGAQIQPRFHGTENMFLLLLVRTFLVLRTVRLV
uniref:Glycoprotein G n=1 Tax=Anisakis simplex TaxID=6269 RepID=A0A0M3JAY4_ANISI